MDHYVEPISASNDDPTGDIAFKVMIDLMVDRILDCPYCLQIGHGPEIEREKFSVSLVTGGATRQKIVQILIKQRSQRKNWL